ncbi:myosin heavy chain, skeletal muscle, adult [Carica papaya]|uniref:myosin heavy chain, skeletal muscle, adult n=1 Tax=Carica papaya TaxID=3649 RepID=UPI000B8CEF6D|nr:myosin heavy chain, skeletal muscle, adult [Carica papaya]
MSWLRTAVNRAVEVGGNNNITRKVRNYADTVVYHAGNAVSEGAKIIQDRIGPRNWKSLRHTVKRLEEVSVSCRGVERVQLLRRWLVALKEIERLTADKTHDNNEKNQDEMLNSDDPKDSPTKPTLVYYGDPDVEGELMNFRDVFLRSQALEGITLSMILEAPNEEELLLLLEIFGLCLTGERKVHNAVMNSIQNLATKFSSYQDEVLVKREELLQYAQDAIAGLKINADLARIDAEAQTLIEKLDNMNARQQSSNECQTKLSEEITGSSLKVDKLKVLSESLVSSSSKAEKRILDHRYQKEEALRFRVARTNEVSQLETELAMEIGQLETQKDELEAELKQVNTSLASARARLHNTREEREQFDEASNQILEHLKSKEDELSRSISSCRVEADIVNRWINFLEDTWVLQSMFIEEKEKKVNEELDTHGEYFVHLVIHLLSTYKDQLEPSVAPIKKLVEELQPTEGSEAAKSRDTENSQLKSLKRFLKEEYLEFEAKFLTTLSIVDEVKRQFYAQNEGNSRKNDKRIIELCNALDKIKEDFEFIERVISELETSAQRSESPPSRDNKPSQNQHYIPMGASGSPEHKHNWKVKYLSMKKKAETDIVKLESEFEDSAPSSTEDIGEWEFDELEKELNISG